MATKKRPAARPATAAAYTEPTHQNVMLLAAMAEITAPTARRAMEGKHIRARYDRERIARAAATLGFTLPPEEEAS